MRKIRAYISEAVNELRFKVSWPSWPELQNSAVVVMVASLIIALLVFVMDIAFQGSLNLIYSMFA